MTLASLLASPAIGDARPPEIRNVNLRGLQIGATTVLTLDGVDLLPAPRIYLGEQALEAVVDPQSTATRLIVAVPVAETIAPGISSLRIATVEGISNSQLVGLDRFPQLAITETISTLPVAVHGSVPGSGVSRTGFTGKTGEELIVEVEARRLGSKLRPVIHVYDSRRVQLAWGTPSTTLAGDARVVLKLPRDDQYTVELHDALYAPPGASHFRMKIGQWQFADFAFPPAVARGQDSSVDLLGNAVGLKVSVHPNDASVAPVPWPNSATAAGLPPTLLASDLPERIKTADQPMALAGAPVAVSGRLTAPGQRDRFQLPTPPGTKLLFEVFAERIGSRIDAVLEIRNKQNALIASNDDGPNTMDPRLEFTVPADQDSLEISLRDNLDLGGDAAIYRLVVSLLDAPLRQFDVVVKSDAVNVAAGESQVLEAFVTRQAYDGPIQLLVAGLPPGATTQGVEIPAGANGSLITFTNTGDAVVSLVTRLRAQSPDGTMARPVRVESTPDDRSPAWVREQVAIAATPKAAAPFQAIVVNEASLTQLVMASKPAMTVKLVRPPATYGPIRLTLVTSQPPPKLNGQPNPNLAIRAEKPVEAPVDPAVKAAGDALAAVDKEHAEAVKQAQAAQGDAKIASDAKVVEVGAKKTAAETTLREAEAKAIYQVDYSAIIPSTISESSCDISIRAELLNPEKNLVLRTTYTPVKRLPLLNPLAIKLAMAVPIETVLDPAAGATVKVPAAIERLAGYAGDITVTVTGLPAGVSAANVAIKADQAEFAIEVKIPANFAATEIAGLKLTATGPPDPLSGNIPVKSLETTITIKINKPGQ